MLELVHAYSLFNANHVGSELIFEPEGVTQSYLLEIIETGTFLQHLPRFDALFSYSCRSINLAGHMAQLDVCKFKQG